MWYLNCIKDYRDSDLYVTNAKFCFFLEHFYIGSQLGRHMQAFILHEQVKIFNNVGGTNLNYILFLLKILLTWLVKKIARVLVHIVWDFSLPCLSIEVFEGMKKYGNF